MIPRCPTLPLSTCFISLLLRNFWRFLTASIAWLRVGFAQEEDTYLYVSDGAVGSCPCMRLYSTMEYILVVLRSPAVRDPTCLKY